MVTQPWTPFFGIACAGLGTAFVAALRVRLRAARALGDHLHEEGGDGCARLVTALGLAAATTWLVVAAGPPSPLATAAVVLAMLCLLLRPSSALALCGTGGVQRGWMVRSFAELDEWRLAGAHLRFRIGSRWLAVELPPEHHEETRERLRARAPGRESPFR